MAPPAAPAVAAAAAKKRPRSKDVRGTTSRIWMVISIVFLCALVICWISVQARLFTIPTTECEFSSHVSSSSLVKPTTGTTTTNETRVRRNVEAQRHISQEALNQFCPYAMCNTTTDLCDACRRRYVILVAMRRSASTTLQYMLHALPGIRMSGENNNVISFMRQMMDNTRKSQWKDGASRQAVSSWAHQPYPESAFACVAQQMIETINPPPNHNGKHDTDDTETIVGFKTIRLDVKNDAIQNYRFIQEHFPCSKVIVNIRTDFVEHAKSRRKHTKWTVARLNDQELVHKLKQEVDHLKMVRRVLHPQQYRILDSTQWLKNITLFNQNIADWLGFDPACHFQQAFELNAKINGFKHGEHTRLNPSDCKPLPF